MPTSKPRILPIEASEVNEKARLFLNEVEGTSGLPGGSKLNIVRTIAHHPDLATAYFTFGQFVLGASTLSPPIREIAILRTASLHNSDYEWTLHAIIARQVGVSEAEIEATKIGPHAPAWKSDLQRSVISAADQLKKTTSLDDPTWAVLAKHLDEKQLLDLLFTIGQYAMLAMVLNSIGVELESL